MVQLLSPDGEYGVAKQWSEYAQYIDKLTEAEMREMALVALPRECERQWGPGVLSRDESKPDELRWEKQ